MQQFNRLELNFRQIALPPLLGLTVFLVASFCMPFPHWSNGNSSLWLATGVSLAALLRTPCREWLALVAASAIGNIAASLYSMDETWLLALSRSGTNAFEYCACAWVVRRRCGSYFDLTDPRHLAWLAGASCIASLIKVFINFTLIHYLRFNATLSAGEIITWAPTAIFGLFVLSLPILAITSRSAVSEANLDIGAPILLVVLVAQVGLIFGPMAFPAVYIVMPVMMMLGWRYGLLGAGLGALLTVTVSIGLTRAEFGVVDDFRAAGYPAQFRGSYLALFFIVTILSGVPLAILRSRQRVTATQLADALTAAERRAVELASSEAAARKAEVKALKSEADALQTREELGRVIETSIDIICTLDMDGHFTRVSENCFEMWGWRRDELLGRSWFDFIHEDDHELAMKYYRLRTTGKFSLPVRHRHVRPDGTVVPMFWAMSWIEEDQASYCVGRDMTEQDELQERAAQAQRMDSIGQLTGGIAHDFNNLLTVVLGNCQILALTLKEPKLLKLAQMSARAAEQGAELVSQLLAFGRRQPLKPKQFDVRELLNSAAPLITRTLNANIEFSVKCSEKLWPAFADPLQLETAVLNLCINARDAMPQGGKLLIDADNVSLAENDLQMQTDAPAGDYVRICVRDTGTGIPPALIERIFEPFFTTKEVGKGSGLGLSMVYGFLRQSRGHIDVSSEPGTGTTFSLYIPAIPAGVGGEDRQSTRGAIHSGVGTVLIVEDHDLVREHARNQFESLGYSVITAQNGSEAIAILDQNRDIALLFTDVVMPGGLSGFDLGKVVSQKWASTKIIYTSGYLQDHIHDFDSELLLLKPYSLEALSRKIDYVMGDNSPSQKMALQLPLSEAAPRYRDGL